MKAAGILAVLFTIAAARTAAAQDFEARLISIACHDGGGCSADSPVRVSACFSVDHSDPLGLSMVLLYSPGITYTVGVDEIDSLGLVHYSFCSKPGQASSFRLYFRDKEGCRSNIFDICAVTPAAQSQDNNSIRK